MDNPPAMQEKWFPSLGWQDPLEKEMATHSTTLAWEIPWTEEPGRLQSSGCTFGAAAVTDGLIAGNISCLQKWLATCNIFFVRSENYQNKTQRYEVSKVKSPSRVRLSGTPWTVAYQAPPPMGFSRQEYWSRVLWI